MPYPQLNIGYCTGAYGTLHRVQIPMQPLALATPHSVFLHGEAIFSHSVTPVSPQSELQPELLLILGAFLVPNIYFSLFL